MWHSRWHSEVPAVLFCLPFHSVPAPILKIHRTIVTSLLIRSNIHPISFVLLALLAWSKTDSNWTQKRGDYTAGWFSVCQCRFYLLQALMFLLACKSSDSLAASHTQEKEPAGTTWPQWPPINKSRSIWWLCHIQSVRIFMVVMVIAMETSMMSFAFYKGLHFGLLFDPCNNQQRECLLSLLFNVRKPDRRKT